MKKILTVLSAVVLLTSCQKELSFDPSITSGAGGTTPGSTNGDLLVKALEISPATKDTNVIVLQWDANKKLLVYNADGKVQGIVTKINHNISRTSEGKITTIVSQTYIGGIISDSVTYRYTYINGSNRVAFILGARTTIFGDLADSTVLTYDAAGKVVSKQIFSDFPFGTWEPVSKEVYEWDANGNITKVAGLAPDGSGGYQQFSLSTYTYDAHKSMVVLGEECFSILPAASLSRNNSTKLVSNAVASGTIYTVVYSQFKFNSFDRPTEAYLSVSPQPPGYDVKLLMYYR